MSVLARDPTDRVRVLDEDGHPIDETMVPDLEDATFRAMYRDMKLARRFDERAVSLQRQGRMGTFPPMSGQEAAQIGSAHALADRDWVFPSYREHAVQMVRGLPLRQILLYWMGHEDGNAVPEDLNLFTITVPIATQIPHATGAAWASKLADDDRAFVVYFGDGATSEGDFHEGMNFGGVFDVPIVYFCNNNQWAISTPRSRQTASESLAVKAEGYGFEGVQVDGMDPLAVYRVTREALGKARNPGANQRRPTLVEAVQYRFGAHTTADDPSVYREDEEVEEWRARDPIPRFETFLRETGRLDDEAVATIESEIDERLSTAIEAAESAIRPHPDELFEHTYAELPERLRGQRETLRRIRERYGDDEILEN